MNGWALVFWSLGFALIGYGIGAGVTAYRFSRLLKDKS